MSAVGTSSPPVPGYHSVLIAHPAPYAHQTTPVPASDDGSGAAAARSPKMTLTSNYKQSSPEGVRKPVARRGGFVGAAQGAARRLEMALKDEPSSPLIAAHSSTEALQFPTLTLTPSTFTAIPIPVMPFQPCLLEPAVEPRAAPFPLPYALPMNTAAAATIPALSPIPAALSDEIWKIISLYLFVPELTGTIATPNFQPTDRIARGSNLTLTSGADGALAGLQTVEKLEELSVPNSTGVTKEVVHTALRHKTLHILNVSNCKGLNIDLATAQLIGKAPFLTQLFLNRCRVNNEAVQAVSISRSIRTLHVADNIFDNAAMAHISQMTQLTSLDISASKVTAASMDLLASLKQLTFLGLRRLDALMRTIADFQKLATLPCLHTLDLSNCGDITDAHLDEFSRFPALRKVTLIQCCSITRSGLETLIVATSRSGLVIRINAMQSADQQTSISQNQLTALTARHPGRLEVV